MSQLLGFLAIHQLFQKESKCFHNTLGKLATTHQTTQKRIIILKKQMGFGMIAVQMHIGKIVPQANPFLLYLILEFHMNLKSGSKVIMIF